jgi:hypothetical protein
MKYFLKQKFKTSDLFYNIPKNRIVVLLEPEVLLSEIYLRHLSSRDFHAIVYSSLDSFYEKNDLDPHVIVLNLDIFRDNFEKIKDFFSDPENVDTDGLEEKAIFYRMERELLIEEAIKRLNNDPIPEI